MKKRTVFFLTAAVLGTLLLYGCEAPSVNGPDAPEAGGTVSGGTVSVSSSAGSPAAEKTVQPVKKEASMEGTWYEQDLNGSRLIISGKNIEYVSGVSDYTDKSRFKTKGIGDTVEIVPDEEFFAVIEIQYSKKEDRITARTYPHTDGDGGYHLLTYTRTVFTPTPEPTYGARKDDSDPGAVTEADDYEFTSLVMSFYDRGDESYIGTDMAQPPPYADDYEYELKVLEDGSGELSSDFCRTIPVSAGLVESIRDLMKENDLASINGRDIHTEGIPADFPKYDFELTLASGEILTSSADHKDVPENWSAFQEAAHHLLFDAFVEAGYNPNTREFHSTLPMKRIGTGERSDLGISKSSEVLLGNNMSYDYSLDAKYTVFEFGEEVTPGLKQALQAYSDELKAAAEQDLVNDFELMENATKKEIKKADRLYAYSFRVAEQLYGDDQLLFILESEGHANSLGIGYSGYGLYPTHRYAFDTQTGERVYAADLFNDEEACLKMVTEAFVQRYRTETGDLLRSQEIQEKLRMSLKGEEGVDPVEFSWGYDSISFYLPESIVDQNGYCLDATVYYDELQELLTDRYTTVR